MKHGLKAIIALFTCLILSFSSMAACAARPIIVDTDAAIDDGIALLYLLNRKDVDIKAISIVATGESHCQPALRNIAGLLKLGDKPSIPMACGRDTPLEGSHKFPEWMMQSADSLYHMTKYLPRATAANSGTAVELLTKTLRESNQPVDIVALGPLTNIAEIITNHPALAAKIRMIYIMGGAVNVSGNVKAVESEINNDTAEWNLYIDPKADDIVFRSGIQITLIALDATNHVPVSRNFYQQLLKSHPKTASAKFIYNLFVLNRHNFLTKAWYFWDPLAAAIATDESIADIKTEKLRIAVAPEEKSGATVADDKNGNNIRVCVNANADKFTHDLLATIMKS